MAAENQVNEFIRQIEKENNLKPIVDNNLFEQIREDAQNYQFTFENLTFDHHPNPQISNAYFEILTKINQNVEFKNKLKTNEFIISREDFGKMTINLVFNDFIKFALKIYFLCENQSTLEQFNEFCLKINQNLLEINNYLKQYEETKSNYFDRKINKKNCKALCKEICQKVKDEIYKKEIFSRFIKLNIGANEIFENIKPFCKDQNLIKLDDLVRVYKYDKWLECMKKFINESINTDLSKLRTIVVGSSGRNKGDNIGTILFNTYTAFIADDTRNSTKDFPESVKRLEDLFNTIRDKSNITQPDYKAINAKKNGFIFINICLSATNSDVIHAVCTIEFINQVIKQNLKVKIFDMRLNMHAHEDNLNIDKKILQEDHTRKMLQGKRRKCRKNNEAQFKAGMYVQYDLFKFRSNQLPLNEISSENGENYRLYRLGHPGFWDLYYKSTSERLAEKEYIQAFFAKIIEDLKIEIDCMYLNKNDYEKVKSLPVKKN